MWDVAALNNRGVDAFESGCIPDATRCFRDAVGVFAPALPPVSVLAMESKSSQSVQVFPSPLVPQCSAAEARGMSRQVSMDSSHSAASSVDSSDPAIIDDLFHQQANQDVASKIDCGEDNKDTSSQRVSQVAQASASTATGVPSVRGEYDEGMNSYNRPLRIEPPSNGSSREDYYCRTVPVLLFNIGLLHLLGGDDAMASDYFLYALDMVSQCTAGGRAPSQTRLDTAMPILHNLGHIYYRAQNYTLALSMYSRALDIVQNARASSQDEARSNLLAAAATLNCLGVIIFHTSSSSDEGASRALEMLTTALDIRTKLLKELLRDDVEDEDDMTVTASTVSSSKYSLIDALMDNDDDEITDAMSVTPVAPPRQDSSCISRWNQNIDCMRREVATTMNNVGRIHYMLGDHAAALSMYIAAYKIRNQLFSGSVNQLDLAASAFNLGQTYHQLGRLDDGAWICLSFVQSTQCSSTDISLRRFTIPSHLSFPTAAMDLYKKFYGIVSGYLGPTHRDVATILKCMAQIHHDRCQYEEAGQLYCKSLKLAKESLGDLNPEVASILNKMGNMFYENSDFNAAIKAYEEGLAVERAVLQSNHQNIVVTLTNIAQSHKHLGNHDTALERYIEAYTIQRAVFGASDLKVACTLSNIAQVSCRLGDFERALAAYREVLQIRRSAHGDSHVDVAATLNSIGLVLFRQGCHGLAIQSFEESLRVRRKCLGEHRDVAVVLYNIATTHLERGDNDEAMSFYKETLRVERSALGRDHPDLVVTLQHIAQVFRQRGELNQTLVYLDEVLRIERLHNGNNCVRVARLLNKMGNIYLQKADVPGMMECFAEAMRIFEPIRASSNKNMDGGNGSEMEELKITGYNFYSLSILHPECAAAA